jgi:hypothetical protein
MVEIFEVHNSFVKPVKELLLISPFKEIWDRDTTKHKDNAIREFSYVYFVVSPKKNNPYSGYKEDERESKVIKGLWKDESWEPDTLIFNAIETYNQWLSDASPSMRYFKAVKAGIEETINFFQSVDFSERNDKGLPVYKIGEVIAALKSANEVLRSMSDLQERVEQEIYESSKTKAGKEINQFER